MNDKPLNTWLSDFDELQNKFPGSVPDSICFSNTNSTIHLVVIAAIHGNETGSLPVIVEAAKKILAQKLNFKITFLIGNRPAVEADKRFIAHDMNRIIMPSAETDFEHVRAQELISAIKTASVLLDLHQTSCTTKSPFTIFTPHADSLAFTSVLKCTDIVIEDMSLVPHGEMSLGEFAQSLGIPSVALELGQKGLTLESFQVGCAALDNAISFLNSLKLDFKDELKKLDTSHMKKMKIVTNITVENEKDHLIDGLVNLAPVAAGQIIGTRASGKNIVTPHAGWILFPKYPKRDLDKTPLEPLGRVICSLAQ